MTVFGDLLRSPELLGPSGTTVSVDTLEGKFVLLYFSAHWCPPCRGFTPILKEYYEALKAQRSDFEIIFVSSDENEVILSRTC